MDARGPQCAQGVQVLLSLHPRKQEACNASMPVGAAIVLSSVSQSLLLQMICSLTIPHSRQLAEYSSCWLQTHRQSTPRTHSPPPASLSEEQLTGNAFTSLLNYIFWSLTREHQLTQFLNIFSKAVSYLSFFKKTFFFFLTHKVSISW